MLDNLRRPVKGERGKDWRLTQKRGERPEFYKKIGRPYHLGLDYAGAKPGDKIPVYASHDGIVDVLNDPKGFGNYVVISGPSYSTYYAHLDSISVKSGDRVVLNSQIGIMGTTGNSSGVHLHFGLRLKDRSKGWKGRIDPTPYISNRPAHETNEDTKYLLQLQEDKIRNGEIGNLDQRMLVIVARIYNKLRK